MKALTRFILTAVLTLSGCQDVEEKHPTKPLPQSDPQAIKNLKAIGRLQYRFSFRSRSEGVEPKYRVDSTGSLVFDVGPIRDSAGYHLIPVTLSKSIRWNDTEQVAPGNLKVIRDSDLFVESTTFRLQGETQMGSISLMGPDLFHFGPAQPYEGVAQYLVQGDTIPLKAVSRTIDFHSAYIAYAGASAYLVATRFGSMSSCCGSSIFWTYTLEKVDSFPVTSQ